ncbi:MAG: hypothetical protein QS748_09430 [Candidatus Endonucleobacter bathymodioli]|uniref:DUF2232 domain-containing protein n=1 Tax=Candidatus Endonucleibacter bathymodioli TaxID=539814 RepID=A0AA90NRS8_9GAMM|nr:hypothetical protein [Candidatus Endonucleobacter bathymodioli]
MRGLAELVMRGSKQAVIMSVFFACIPILLWLSASIVALVILRHGAGQGIKVLMWALLPGVAWAAMGQYSVVMGLLAVAVLALVLRATCSWQKTLLVILPIGGLMALVLAQFAPEQLAQLTNMVMEFLASFLKQADKALDDLGESLELRVQYGVIGMLTWFNLLSSIVGVIVARVWQSWLYNPGGFRKEFQNIRLSAPIAVILLILIFAGSALLPFLLVLAPLASLPLFVAGISLVHGLVELKNMGALWLIVFYIAVVFFAQLAYPVIALAACLDSLFDFRKTGHSNPHAG